MNLDFNYVNDLRNRLHREPCVSGVGFTEYRDADDKDYSDVA